MNQQLKALNLLGPRSLHLANYLLLTFTSKAHDNLQGVFPTMIGFFTLGHLLFRGSCKKAAKGDKTNHG